MEVLKEKLQKELLRQPDLEIVNTATWGLPIHLLNLSYTTIKRTKMDVLMKMLMISFQKMNISSTEEIATFLNVEPLFVKDIVERLRSSSLIDTDNGTFHLTDIGTERLQTGIFEYPPEKDKKSFYYSPSHHVLLGKEQELEPLDDIEEYRWAKQTSHQAKSLSHDELIDALRSSNPEATEGSLQIIYDQVEPPEVIKKLFVPCIEFSLLNQTEQSRFTRVWNTLLGRWDEQLEEQIEEKGPLHHQIK